MQTALALILLCGAPPLLLLLGYLLRSKVRVRKIAEHRLPDLLGASEGPLARLLARHGRAAFLPRTEPGDAEGSHFGGRPWLPKGEDWPTCEACSRPLQLLLQLDLDALPAGAPPQRSGGLAQVFCCTCQSSACDLKSEARAPLGAAQVARIVDSRRLGERAADNLASPGQATPAVIPISIVGWEQGPDLPGREDCGGLGLEDAEAELAERQGLPRSGDKLGGWPVLRPGLKLPPCPRCGETMEFVFQLDALGHTQGASGGSGIGHLARCRTHSTTLAFDWACG